MRFIDVLRDRLLRIGPLNIGLNIDIWLLNLLIWLLNLLILLLILHLLDWLIGIWLSILNII